MKTSADPVDLMLDAWRRELPLLDPSALDQVGRIFVLAQRLEQRVNQVLTDHQLTLGQFDILATLRRQGPTGGLTPKQLLSSVMLTSGGMTSRLDGLAEMGLITRRPDPDDRRGVVIHLTAKGRKRIEQAAESRFAEAKAALPPLSDKELKTLTTLLHKWLIHLAETPV